jgi:hypothetical protein
MLTPKLEVVIRHNHISVRNLDSGKTASAAAPFSCDHLLVDDIDIFEHAANGALKAVTATLWSFPTLIVSKVGQPIHIVEEKVIRHALLNAGASRVVLDGSVERVNEQSIARAAYVEGVKQKR